MFLVIYDNNYNGFDDGFVVIFVEIYFFQFLLNIILKIIFFKRLEIECCMLEEMYEFNEC